MQINKFKTKWRVLSKKLRENVKKCEKCGTDQHLLVHHILPKKFYPELSLDENNLIVLCPRCHNFCRFSAHKDGMAFAIWFMSAKPAQFEWVRKQIMDRPER